MIMLTKFNLINKLDQYLDARRGKGIEAFTKLREVTEKDEVEYVALSFQYENLEALGKKGEKHNLYEHFFGIWKLRIKR